MCGDQYCDDETYNERELRAEAGRGQVTAAVEPGELTSIVQV